MSELDHLLASREMILVAGSGGVGKTTIAAALGVAAAQRQKGKVLVLTVDPARRLATALGLDSFGNTPVRVRPDAARTPVSKIRESSCAASCGRRCSTPRRVGTS